MATAKKKTSRKTAKPASPPPDVQVKVDARLKKAWDTRLAEIARATRGEMTDFDRRWEAAGAIVDHDPPLFVVGGHRDQAEFFREVMNEEPRTARRYVRVARYASPRDEERYGVAKLDAALGFIEAKLGAPLAHPPLPIALDRLRIPVEGGRTKALDQATLVEITRATGKLAAPSKKRPKSAGRTAIETKLAAVAPLANVRVAERGGLVSFDRVPLAALARFARALLSVKLAEPT